MDCKIEDIKIEELKETLDLVKNVFDEFEAPYYTEEGINNFYEFASYNNIQKQLKDNMKIFIVKDRNKIIGMIAITNYSHIAMLFINKKYHKKGIGTRLINYAKYYARINNRKIYSITVNSSPYAIEFYHKIGFKDTDVEKTVDGITFTPMAISIYNFEEYKDEYFNKLYEMKKDNFKWYVEKLYGWDEERQVEFFRNEIKEHRKDINVIKLENDIIGVFTNYINESKESVIGLFYIDKKYQKKGIGTKILLEQLKQDELDKRDTILQVFKENPARFLYKKVGFKTYEETKTHYKMRRSYKESKDGRIYHENLICNNKSSKSKKI